MFVNPSKTKLSFDLACRTETGAAACTSSGGGGAPAAPAAVVVPAALDRASSGAAFVKWCGLLINVDNLEVQGDYTRCVWLGGILWKRGSLLSVLRACRETYVHFTHLYSRSQTASRLPIQSR